MANGEKGKGGLIALAVLFLLGGRREQPPEDGKEAPRPEAQNFELAFGGTHGGALPHPKKVGDLWSFTAGFSYRGPKGTLVAYGRVGHGGTLTTFTMEDGWQLRSNFLPVPDTFTFAAKSIASPNGAVPDVPDSTYDAEAELWHIAAGMTVPASLSLARAASGATFLARDNDQGVYKVEQVAPAPAASGFGAGFE